MTKFHRNSFLFLYAKKVTQINCQHNLCIEKHWGKDNAQWNNYEQKKNVSECETNKRTNKTSKTNEIKRRLNKMFNARCDFCVEAAAVAWNAYSLLQFRFDCQNSEKMKKKAQMNEPHKRRTSHAPFQIAYIIHLKASVCKWCSFHLFFCFWVARWRCQA